MLFHFLCLFFWAFAVFARIPSNDTFCIFKIKVDSRTYRESANLADWAYIYDQSQPDRVIQVKVDQIRVRHTSRDLIPPPVYSDNVGRYTLDGPYQADHVFEAQIILRYFQNLDTNIRTIMCNIINENNLDIGLQNIMNSEFNIRFLDPRINRAKGSIFGGNSVTNQHFNRAAIDYLRNDDVYRAFANTRLLVIEWLTTVISLADVDIYYIRYFELFSSSDYETATGYSPIIRIPFQQFIPRRTPLDIPQLAERVGSVFREYNQHRVQHRFEGVQHRFEGVRRFLTTVSIVWGDVLANLESIRNYLDDDLHRLDRDYGGNRIFTTLVIIFASIHFYDEGVINERDIYAAVAAIVKVIRQYHDELRR
ncbi:13326_t:CDS:2 [Ambispora gerdemannii]|uniref:13326_t:CDS:1 n=1 Tax=Ambispora gerdemannii TaxID=144530 RepID=A0A9N9D966_9GLOM|nr:13326_t:CDS:2 [Ambispora gerdemannii]